METYRLPNFAREFSTIHIALFRNVRNAPDIRKKLIIASTMDGEEGDRARQEVDFGFVEGRLLVSREHLLVAIMTTLLTCLPHSTSSSSSLSTPQSTNTDNQKILVQSEASGSTQPITRTHNLHSELLLTLSPNNNISDSIRRHGISDTTDSLVVVRISGHDSKEDKAYSDMRALVDGELDSLDVLDSDELVDWPRLNKIFKLSELDRLAMTLEEIREKKIATIVNTVAIKHVT